MSPVPPAFDAPAFDALVRSIFEDGYTQGFVDGQRALRERLLEVLRHPAGSRELVAAIVSLEAPRPGHIPSVDLVQPGAEEAR